MPHPRFTIARLLALILFFGIIFAGLRSGSDDWFKLIYSLTFLTLVYTAIAVRYRGAFWHGFAIACAKNQGFCSRPASRGGEIGKIMRIFSPESFPVTFAPGY